ncbi:MAG: hypothetical protein Q8R04_04705 [Nanoarchaeota archaeon]|nr:hypothetical protein [Nanoarchaeota archaeon]
MQFINYFFASLISFSGLLIGILLIKIAPEEQKPLGKYLILLRKILLLIIFAFVLFYYFNDYFNIIILIAYFLFLLLVEFRINDLLKKSIITYTMLGILFFLSSKNANLFTIEASLILLYGMPTASLIYNKKQRNHYKLIFYNIGFVIIANLVLFL